MIRLINTEEDLKRFLGGQGTDHLGRKITEILEKDDIWWERGHDFIQWVFPTTEKSHYNWLAPTVKNPEGYATPYMEASLERYKLFLSQANWKKKGDHNQRRITRVLKCLKLFGYEEEAKAFLHSWKRNILKTPNSWKKLFIFGSMSWNNILFPVRNV